MTVVRPPTLDECTGNAAAILDFRRILRIRLLRTDGIAFFLRAQVGSGPRSSPGHQKISPGLSVNPRQVALAWLLKRSKVIVPISGTLSAQHLEENVASSALELSEEANQVMGAVQHPANSARLTALGFAKPYYGDDQLTLASRTGLGWDR